jgi:hypothetical protein
VPLVLSAVGIVSVLATRAWSLPAKLVTTVFPISYYLAMGTSSLAFQRYMLPVLPFLAVLAAVGAHRIRPSASARLRVGWRARTMALHVGVAGVLAVALIINVAHAFKHDALLLGDDTRKSLSEALAHARLPPSLRVFAGRYTRIPVQRGLPAPAFSPETRSLPEARSHDLLILDSFSHDRLVNGPIRRAQHESKPGDPFGDPGGLYVVQWSPFTVPKHEMPFTPESLYSPYRPDLMWRRQAGPFIEIYSRDPVILMRIAASCAQVRPACPMLPGDSGYYFRVLRAPAAAKRP